MTKQSGFTLVEMMIALAVAVAAITVAVPSFLGLVKDNRQTTQINDLNNAMLIARSESIKQNGPFSVCQSNNGTGCTNTGWDDGWIVFSDRNTQGTIDGTDQVIKIFGAINTQTALTSTSFPSFITYESDGTSSSNGDFKMCDDRGSASAKVLCVSATGRSYIRDTTCAGGAITCP